MGDAGILNLTGAPVGEVLGDIRAVQVSAMFRQMPIALTVNIVNAALTVIVLHGSGL
jgi:hypothetical protein